MKGLGFFLNSADTRGDGSKFAKEMKECHTAWAALWCGSPDGRKVKLETLKQMSDDLKVEGIKSWVWIFPSADNVEASAKWVLDCAAHIGAEGIILDIELPFKGKPKAAEDFMKAINDNIPCHIEVAFTSYPFGHPTLPWSKFVDCNIGMPQLYYSAELTSNIRRSFREYGERFEVVVPVCATYIEDSGRLKADLERMISVAPKMPAIAVWVWRTSDASEREVLGEFAKKYWP